MTKNDGGDEPTAAAPPADEANAPEGPAPAASDPGLSSTADEKEVARVTEPDEPKAATEPPVPSAMPAPAPAKPAPPSGKGARIARRSLADRLREPEDVPVELPAARARARSRRDFLLFGAGALAAAGGLWWLLPDETRELHLTEGLRHRIDSIEARLGATSERRETFLNRALTFDDDVAEALYSKDRAVRTYSRSQTTPLRNNYNGATPNPGYIAGWTLAISGLASGRKEALTVADLARIARRDQVTRLCCVEGWSAVAWWGGFRFADFLRAYPPDKNARWAKLLSAVNVDGSGNPDPYYVSIDLRTAEHPQSLFATHLSGRPLTAEHGAPLRLVVPMKLGLKNIKAVTAIEYSEDEPEDYWNERGYSKYDGL
jgi:DMSO/TMAO reductase YedYZ molybdopterin-dependent catalytic subunit